MLSLVNGNLLNLFISCYQPFEKLNRKTFMLVQNSNVDGSPSSMRLAHLMHTKEKKTFRINIEITSGLSHGFVWSKLYFLGSAINTGYSNQRLFKLPISMRIN